MKKKSLEGATSVSNFVHKVNVIFGSFLSRGLNMMNFIFDVAKNMLDMGTNVSKSLGKKSYPNFEKITIL